MKNIIIFGPPGTGKGTMSKKMSEEFGLIHISTGDLIRENQKNKTKIGLLADKMVNSGGFLPDEIVNEMIKQKIIENKDSNGFLFDGFPRTTGQAKMIDQFLNKVNHPVNIAIHLEIDKYNAKTRILDRGKKSGRADDNEVAFETRWLKYQKETVSAINYFDGRGKLSKVNSNQLIDDVYSEIREILKN